MAHQEEERYRTDGTNPVIRSPLVRVFDTAGHETHDGYPHNVAEVNFF